VAAFLVLEIKDAWLSDDAYITFRTVYNFTHGYGWVWNLGERVQSSTHPLWMFLLTIAYALGHDMYWSSLVLCLTVSLAAVVVVALGIASSPWRAVLCVALLCASKSFLDFSTSGLENPLTHLLLALFAVEFLQGCHTRRKLFFLSLTAGLATFNRMDTALLYVPAVAFALGELTIASVPVPLHLRPAQVDGTDGREYVDYVASVREWLIAAAPNVLRNLGVVALGFAPFLLWECFSLWYYGFPFPNTAYAKLHTGVGHKALLKQGLYYLGGTFAFDPLLLVSMSAGFILPFILRNRRCMLLVLGGLFYVGYTVYVGGDFMAGRFLTAPFLVAVIVLANIELPHQAHLPKYVVRGAWLVALVAVLAVGIFQHASRWGPDHAAVQIGAHGIANERDYYLAATGIWTIGFGPTTPRHRWAEQGLEAAESGQRVTVFGSVGFYGFEAGPHVYIVDIYALSDPLLARLPAKPRARIGHYIRNVPAGYVATLETGRNELQDPQLALYYDHLRIVTRGNLFDLQRLVEIWKFNTGQYDDLLHGYAG
jgi:arabinofuranosyltransferase